MVGHRMGPVSLPPSGRHSWDHGGYSSSDYEAYRDWTEISSLNEHEDIVYEQASGTGRSLSEDMLDYGEDPEGFYYAMTPMRHSSTCFTPLCAPSEYISLPCYRHVQQATPCSVHQHHPHPIWIPATSLPPHPRSIRHSGGTAPPSIYVPRPKALSSPLAPKMSPLPIYSHSQRSSVEEMWEGEVDSIARKNKWKSAVRVNKSGHLVIDYSTNWQILDFQVQLRQQKGIS
ncbi:unnamed protein product [Darwinula stevensoni]|uniref:Uncharacterized protein n=1 Tax=Darwinula stevensoni TaxID=69355 RepID=A0A7R9A5E8_9CRUS|nr:unnamed protein product [Darwinula stevensoni]CAG0891872.1 unnamed protein product [Darwinula stevensoni]